jgi:hypothetical protein
VSELKIDLVIEAGEDSEAVARELIGTGKAELVSVGYEGGQWPTATYRGTRAQLAAVHAKSVGSVLGKAAHGDPHPRAYGVDYAFSSGVFTP